MKFTRKLHACCLQLLQQFPIDSFNQIIAHLVQPIDRAFGLRDFVGRGPRRASVVFLVPQGEILTVLLDHQSLEPASCSDIRIRMPTCGEVILKFRDFGQLHGE